MTRIALNSQIVSIPRHWAERISAVVDEEYAEKANESENSFRVVIIQRGVGFVTEGQAVCSLESGDVVVIQPGSSWVMYAGIGFKYACIQFDKELFSIFPWLFGDLFVRKLLENRRLTSYTLRDGAIVSHLASSRLKIVLQRARELHENIHKVRMKDPEINNAVIIGTLAIVLSQCAQELLVVHSCISRHEKQLRSMFDVMQREPQLQWGLVHMGEFLHVHPSYVNRLFQRSVNCSVVEWVRMIRMTKSCFLVCTSSLQVKFIVENIGFIDVHHHARLFKRLWGTTPINYRKKFVAHMASRVAQMQEPISS